MKKKVTLSIDSKSWSRFKTKCKDDYLIPSLEIEKFIKQETNRWIE